MEKNKELTIAAQEGDLTKVKKLFTTPKECSHDTLDLAAQRGFIAIVKFLIKKEAPCSEWAINFAVFEGRIEIINLLLAYRKKILTERALLFAIQKKDFYIIRLLIDNNVPITEASIQLLECSNSSLDFFKIIGEYFNKKQKEKAID